MSYFEALLYGAVQGIAEYLPISSSAHLILLPKFLGERSYGLAFDVFLHLGTLMATLIYFWREWRQTLATVPLIGGWFKPKRPSMPGDGSGVAPASWEEPVDWKLIVIGTIPALIVGALAHKYIATVLRGNLVIIITLTLGGVLLFVSDRFFKQLRTLRQLDRYGALWVGIAQCFALIPGISRAGATMTGGRLLKLDRASAAKFSFLLSAPVTAAAVVFELRHWSELVNGPIGLGPLLVAGFSSFIFGMIAIGGLLRILRRFGFGSFALYRICLAAVIYFVLGV